MHLAFNKLLNILAGLDADLFQRRSALADDHALVLGRGHIDQRMDDRLAALGVFLPAFDVHGDAVGNLLPQQQKELFANDFRRHEAHRRGRDLILGEQILALGQQALEQRGQLGQTVLAQRGNRKDFRAGPHLIEARQQGEHAALVRKHVHLVDNHHEGTFVAGQRLSHGRNVALQKFRLADVEMGVQHQHDDIGLTKALPYGLNHGFAETAAHLRQARRIHEDGLRVIVGQNADDLIARGLRFGGHDGDFLPEQSVQQCGLARVGRPHEGDPAAAMRRLLRHDVYIFLMLAEYLRIRPRFAVPFRRLGAYPLIFPITGTDGQEEPFGLGTFSV